MYRYLYLLLLFFCLSFKASAQNIFITIGGMISSDHEKGIGNFTSYNSLPYGEVTYYQTISPFLSIGSGIKAYSMKNDIEDGGFEWKTANLEIPVRIRYGLGFVKFLQLETGIFVGFNLKSELSIDPNNDGIYDDLIVSKVAHKSPYLGITPINAYINLGKFLIRFPGFSVRLTDFKSPDNPVGLRYEDKTYLLHLDMGITYRLK